MNLEDIERLKESERRLEQRLDRGDRGRLRRRRQLLGLVMVAVFMELVLLAVVAFAAAVMFVL